MPKSISARRRRSAPLPNAPGIANTAAMTSLHLAGTYRRTVAASLARLRENVLDWEHLPALHASSFAACELIDEDKDGWRIRLVGQHNAAPQTLKLHLAADTSHYTVITEAGSGATSEIRVAVVAEAEHTTRVVVEYHVPESDPHRLASPTSARRSSRSTNNCGMRTKP